MSNPDDLDDGMLYDFEVGEEGGIAPEENEIEEDEHSPSTNAGTKRKMKEQEHTEERPLSKRQKKLAKNPKLREKKREQVEYEISRRKHIPKGSPEEISEYFASIIRERSPDLSALELEELYLKKSSILATTKFETERNLGNYAEFVRNFCKAPRSIIICMSNMRVADVFRSLNKETKDCVKLFSKNKLSMDLETVKREFEQKPTSADSGKYPKIRHFIVTPTRLQKLLDSSEAFFEGKDKLDVILDASYLDAKDNTLITSENTIVLVKALKMLLAKKSSVRVLLY